MAVLAEPQASELGRRTASSTWGYVNISLKFSLILPRFRDSAAVASHPSGYGYVGRARWHLILTSTARRSSRPI